MTTLIHTADTIGLHSFANWLTGLKTKLQHRRRVNNAIKELNRLSDRELRDIGIHRSMIRSVAEGTYYG